VSLRRKTINRSGAATPSETPTGPLARPLTRPLARPLPDPYRTPSETLEAIRNLIERKENQ